MPQNYSISTFRIRDMKEVPSRDNALSADSFPASSIVADLLKKIESVKIGEQKQSSRKTRKYFESSVAHPIGCPVAASVFIITFSTSPNLLKCWDRPSLVAAK